MIMIMYGWSPQAHQVLQDSLLKLNVTPSWEAITFGVESNRYSLGLSFKGLPMLPRGKLGTRNNIFWFPEFQ
jgi:hypothetical protein